MKLKNILLLLCFIGAFSTVTSAPIIQQSQYFPECGCTMTVYMSITNNVTIIDNSRNIMVVDNANNTLTNNKTVELIKDLTRTSEVQGPRTRGWWRGQHGHGWRNEQLHGWRNDQAAPGWQQRPFRHHHPYHHRAWVNPMGPPPAMHFGPPINYRW